MRFGTCLPYMKREYRRQTTLDWCRRIDASPFATLSCGERITSYSQEMRVLLSAAAALTGPPILAGAMGPRAIARAARWADGIYGFSVNAALEPVREGFALTERASELILKRG